MENIYFKQHFSTMFRHLTKKMIGSVYRNTYFHVYLNVLALKSIGIRSPH